MSKPISRVNAAEISRLAGVTRATVSNWRRRHADFPKPATGGTEARPVFDLHEVQDWLAEHGVEAAETPISELRALVRSHATPDTVALVLAALRYSTDGWVMDGLGDVHADLAARIPDAIARAAAEHGTRAALDVLADRALADTTATGVYSTPAEVAKVMAELLISPATPAVHSALDPSCGSGSLLLAAARVGVSEVYGQDLLPIQVERTRLLLEAEAGLAPVVRSGDSLASDAFPDLAVDAVLCNPPYGQRDWGSGDLSMDTRWDYGTPPRLESELAWVQHGIAHLRPGGTAVLLLPPAVATRPSGRRIRANLVRKGALRAVIGLAPGTAQPWHVGLQIWVLRRPQPGIPAPDSMLFVDTTALSAETDGWDAVADAVLRAWRAFDGPVPEDAIVSGVAASVRLVEVLDDDVDLTPARYVRSALDSGTVSDEVGAAVHRLTRAATELLSAADALGGWSESPGVSWRFRTIGEMLNHEQLQWIRSEPPSTDQQRAGDPRRVLTAPDIATGSPASGTLASSAPSVIREVALGDVLIPAVRSDRTGGRSARVAGPDDAGAILGPHVHTLRVAHESLDPWFLAGFLTGAENVSATRTSTVRFDPSRLRIPVLALAEQQRYGQLFRLLFNVRTAARRATYAAEHTAELVTTGLTAGALAPDDDSAEASEHE
ncbi:N-6 DNA methylase [Nocardia sp. IFM 10818]